MIEGAARPSLRPEITSTRQLLTPREFEILNLIVHGYTGKEMARMLGGGSVRTIEAHRRSIAEKFGARNLSHMAAIAVAAGFVSLELPEGLVERIAELEASE